jgi:probable DNA metabolism protein
LDGIYFAKIDPDFDVLTLIIRHFKIGIKIKMDLFMIYDENMVCTIKMMPKQDGGFRHQIAGRSKQCGFSDTELNYQKLWWEYFDHTNIKERKTPNCTSTCSKALLEVI